MQRFEGPATLPLQTRDAPLGTVDAGGRTVEVIWTTGAAVRRRRWIGYDTSVPFDEELLVSDAAINLSRLKAGAPVLDSHMVGSIDAQRAVVDDAWVSSGKGYARLRFPSKGTDPGADRLFEMARQKVIRNISVGYSIDRVRVVEPKNAAEVERRIVERWTPYELSFVTVPADAGAQTRSTDARSFPVIITRGSGRGGHRIGEAGAALARMRMRARAVGIKL